MAKIAKTKTKRAYVKRAAHWTHTPTKAVVKARVTEITPVDHVTAEGILDTMITHDQKTLHALESFKHDSLYEDRPTEASRYALIAAAQRRFVEDLRQIKSSFIRQDGD